MSLGKGLKQKVAHRHYTPVHYEPIRPMMPSSVERLIYC